MAYLPLEDFPQKTVPYVILQEVSLWEIDGEHCLVSPLYECCGHIADNLRKACILVMDKYQYAINMALKG